MTQEEKTKYKVYSMRLNAKTWKELAWLRKQSGLSWNRFIVLLINKIKQL